MALTARDLFEAAYVCDQRRRMLTREREALMAPTVYEIRRLRAERIEELGFEISRLAGLVNKLHRASREME